MTAVAPLKYSHTLGFMANQGRGFNNPVDLAIDSGGTLFVLNRGRPGDWCAPGPTSGSPGALPMRNTWVSLGTGGTNDGGLWWPSSLAFDSADRLYIADEALNRISIFDRDGTYLGKWGVAGAGEGQFNHPSFILFDREDNLLVTDSLNHRVQKYTKDGEFLAQWGTFRNGVRGSSICPGAWPWAPLEKFTPPTGAMTRIQKFDAEGNCLGAFGESGNGEGQFHRPAGLAVDDVGNLIVADWGNERVQALDLEGNFLATFRGESRTSLWAEDYFSANPDEANARRDAQLEPELEHRTEYDSHRGYEWERSANVEKLFWGPTSVKIGLSGLVYIVDSLRHRIQIYRNVVGEN